MTRDTVRLEDFLPCGNGIGIAGERVLGNTSDAEGYAELAQEVKSAFNSEFVTLTGRVGPTAQTAFVLALHFDLLPDRYTRWHRGAWQKRYAIVAII